MRDSPSSLLHSQRSEDRWLRVLSDRFTAFAAAFVLTRTNPAVSVSPVVPASLLDVCDGRQRVKTACTRI